MSGLYSVIIDIAVSRNLSGACSRLGHKGITTLCVGMCRDGTGNGAGNGVTSPMMTPGVRTRAPQYRAVSLLVSGSNTQTSAASCIERSIAPFAARYARPGAALMARPSALATMALVCVLVVATRAVPDAVDGTYCCLMCCSARALQLPRAACKGNSVRTDQRSRPGAGPGRGFATPPARSPSAVPWAPAPPRPLRSGRLRKKLGGRACALLHRPSAARACAGSRSDHPRRRAQLGCLVQACYSAVLLASGSRQSCCDVLLLPRCVC